MKFQNLFKLVMLIILAGCGVNQPDNIFETGSSFPQDTCIEKPPTDAKDVTFYPVFIYSNDLQSVQEKYCRDANVRAFAKEPFIRVASFLSKERANQFKDFLKNKFENAEVGKPKTFNLQITDENQISSNAESIAKAAKLTSEQLQQILKTRVRIEEGMFVPVKVALPTYLPPGFEVEEVKLSEFDDSYGEFYTITYRNHTTNESIYMQGGGNPIGIGGADVEFKSFEVFSPTLGKVNINYTDSSQVQEGSEINFHVLLHDNYYYVQTPSGGGYENKNSRSLTAKEMVKIAESFQYL